MNGKKNNMNHTVSTAFKTRVRLNNRQKSTFKHWSNCKRYAYNWALRLCFLENETVNKLNLSRINEFDKYFNAGKYPLNHKQKHKTGYLIGTGEHEWLRGVPASICQIAIKYDLKDAWKRFFKKLAEGRPKFHGRYAKRSFKLSNATLQQKSITSNGYIELPGNLGKSKLGDLPEWWDRCRLLNTTFSEQGGKWYVSFTVECQPEDYYRYHPERQRAVGVDVGIHKMAALSNGELVKLDRSRLKHLQNRVDQLQKKLGVYRVKALKVIVNRCSKCSEKSINGMNDIRKLCHACYGEFRKKPGRNNKGVKLQESINNARSKMIAIRENGTHQLTTSLVKRFEIVVIEDLKIKNMTASAKGTEEKPGAMVKQKSGLNREFLNVSPYRIRSQLKYKTERTGGRMIPINPRNTSIKCSKCGYTDKGNRKKEKFHCLNCGFKEDADIQAALNIKKIGIDKFDTLKK